MSIAEVRSHRLTDRFRRTATHESGMKEVMMRASAAIIATLVCVACSKGEAPAAAERVEVGQPAPRYSALTMTGDSVSLVAQRGQVVLMNMWATWCGPCRKEIPELRAIHSTYKDRGLKLIGVSVDADGMDDAIRAFLKEF